MQIALPEQRKSYDESNSLERDSRRLHEFIAKWNHDWMMLSAAGLAYSLMVAVVPFGIAILAVLGFTLGHLNPAAQSQLIENIKNAFPSAISSKNILQPAITRLNNSAGFLLVLAVVTAIFGGSRLFIAIERCFDIVYRTYPRKLIRQYSMALLMMLVFIILTPIMAFASSLPAVVLALIQSSTLSKIPGVVQLASNGFVLTVASISGGIIVGWMLFQATYMVVPNQKISFKKSWKGAIAAAVLLEIFLFLFPFYVTHFMTSYTGVAGFAVIFLLFLYYFAMILLFGGQINAYFAEGVSPLPNTLARVLRDTFGKSPQEPGEQRESASATASIASSQTAGSTAPVTRAQTDLTSAPEAARPPSTPTMEEAGTDLALTEQKRHLLTPPGLRKKPEREAAIHPAPKKKRSTKTGIIVEAVAGTALAFAVTALKLREKL